jgi:hypothetical protein
MLATNPVGSTTRGLKMTTNRLIEIEFSSNTDVVEAANRAISRLSNHLELDQFTVEALVRVDQRLVNPWADGAAAAQRFAYRIHLGSIRHGAWAGIRHDFLQPLADQGVAVREIRLAA